jgi:hypothetical protein
MIRSLLLVMFEILRYTSILASQTQLSETPSLLRGYSKDGVLYSLCILSHSVLLHSTYVQTLVTEYRCRTEHR